MKEFRVGLLVGLAICCVGVWSLPGRLPTAQARGTQSSITSPPDHSKITVYVSNFEIDVPESKDAQAAAAGAPLAPKKDEGLADRAHKLVDAMAASLIGELQRAGYDTKRLLPGTGRPATGVRINGVFAEYDQENRLRRAIIGSGAPSSKLQLFVGVTNLARPEQPLYSLTDLKGNENKPGAAITVNAYAPVTKFEIGKDVGDEIVRKTAAQIVTDLTALVNNNSLAISE